MHPERERALRHELADPPEPEDAEPLLVQLDPGELGALPLTARQRRVRLRHVAGEREQQRHRVLGRRDHVRLGRVGDDDPTLRGGGDIDVVDPDPGSADGAEAIGLVDHLGVELRRRADEDALVPGDALPEFVSAPADAEIDVEVLPEQVDP